MPTAPSACNSGLEEAEGDSKITPANVVNMASCSTEMVVGNPVG